jgi:hypothetical protein
MYLSVIELATLEYTWRIYQEERKVETSNSRFSMLYNMSYVNWIAIHWLEKQLEDMGIPDYVIKEVLDSTLMIMMFAGEGWEPALEAYKLMRDEEDWIKPGPELISSLLDRYGTPSFLVTAVDTKEVFNVQKDPQLV